MTRGAQRGLRFLFVMPSSLGIKKCYGKTKYTIQKIAIPILRIAGNKPAHRSWGSMSRTWRSHLGERRDFNEKVLKCIEFLKQNLHFFLFLLVFLPLFLFFKFLTMFIYMSKPIAALISKTSKSLVLLLAKYEKNSYFFCKILTIFNEN